MSKKINNPVYYVPYVKIRFDFKAIGCKEVKRDEEYAIYDDESSFNYNPNEISIVVPSKDANNIIKIPITHIDIFVKQIFPKFKIGDIVRGKDSKEAFRIFQYTILHGKIWYRNGWSVATNCENGCLEDNLELSSDNSGNDWSVKYYDDLVKEQNPSLYNVIVKN